MAVFLAITAAARPAGVVVESVAGWVASPADATVGVKATPINVALMGLASKPVVILVVA